MPVKLLNQMTKDMTQCPGGAGGYSGVDHRLKILAMSYAWAYPLPIERRPHTCIYICKNVINIHIAYIELIFYFFQAITESAGGAILLSIT